MHDERIPGRTLTRLSPKRICTRVIWLKLVAGTALFAQGIQTFLAAFWKLHTGIDRLTTGEPRFIDVEQRKEKSPCHEFTVHVCVYI